MKTEKQKRWHKYSHTKEYREYNNKRQLKYQAELRRLGICVSCGACPREDKRSKNLCNVCVEKVRITSEKWRKKLIKKEKI